MAAVQSDVDAQEQLVLARNIERYFDNALNSIMGSGEPKAMHANIAAKGTAANGHDTSRSAP